MAQEKEEPVVSDDAAPDGSAQIEPSLAHDTSAPNGRDGLAPVAEDPAAERPDRSVATAPAGDVPESDAAAANAGADIDSTGAAEAEPIAPPVDPTPIRRILPIGSSTALGSAALAARTPWTPLRKLSSTVIIAWGLFLLGLGSAYLLGRSHLVSAGIFLLSAMLAGIVPVIDLVRQARRLTVPVALLPVTAALGAIVIGHWLDAALLLACYATVLALHMWIVRKSEEPLRALVAARVSRATVTGTSQPTPLKEITVGDSIHIGKNEIVPLDGSVETGSTMVDQSVVTGSAVPVEKQRGSDLYAGSRNLGAPIDLRVARRPSQRTIARVAKLAKTALPHPSRAQQMLEELAGVYALAMLAVGALAFLVLLVLGDHAWTNALQRVIAFLIAASPAALLLTIGVAYRAAMANALRHGVLFRGQDELEILGTVETIAFDKTGTLTQGKPVVTGVVNCTTGWTDDQILAWAASAELHSDHRLGRAIVDAARARGLPIPEPADCIPSPGKGIVSTVENRTVAVGNANLFAELGVNIWRATEISADMRDEGQSAVLVGDRENVRGVIGVSDPLRPEAPEIVADLGTLRIRRTAMLTGDDGVVASVIANEAGLREVYADLLPEEKLGVVRQMEQGAPVGMIAGAGENSPTLSIATVGIALGSIAADVTREPAGVLLFGGELAELPFALWIARTARRTTTIGLIVLIGVMAVLGTGALVVGIPPVVVILVSFVATLAVLLAGLRMLHATRRLPRHRPVPRIPAHDGEASIGPAELPGPRYVIDDDEDDEDEDDL